MENWDDMRVFLAVARAESLTGAAPILKMDPATLGRRIARLERSLGAALFVKSPQGYALTDLGERMRDRAAEAEAHLILARETGQGASSGLSGQIRIGAPDGAANFLLPQVCAAVQAEHPALEIQILSLPRVVNLSRREADMAVTVSPPATGRLSVQRISDYKLHLATRQDGPQIARRADLNGQPIVGYISDMIFDKELDYLGELGADGVQMASNSVAVQLQMLRQSGVGIVHDFALPFAPELHRVLVDDISLTRSFYLVRHTSDRQSERLNSVADAIMSGIQAEITRLEGIARLTDAPVI
ncbi:LysR family transcriptional regulator [Yoonia sp. I 8.24]|uniref:LysR family transcriptional regulator n=1 Tax=Yoonia sp. I 8.24 TaxID=1537229 RepID=UPI001EDF13C1|nr:LysR family transcriptional regulator [Yoonia sp. I 8.24]MCG3267506.1 LysR family transcriptional regulator [Yoonia sp. I 8.24]